MGAKTKTKGFNEKWGWHDIRGRSIQKITTSENCILLELSSGLELEIRGTVLNANILVSEKVVQKVKHQIPVKGLTTNGA